MKCAHVNCERTAKPRKYYKYCRDHGERLNRIHRNRKQYIQTIAARDGWKCGGTQGSVKGCQRDLLLIPEHLIEIDHVMPLSRGGKTVLDNLQLLCHVCNHAAGDNTEAELVLDKQST